MGRNNYFQFKQFKIIQEKSAMKVGIDGILLGAWANLVNATSIIDIGTGTGLITLMMAQRSDARITAIEIDKNAYSEACFNVDQSPWREKISVIHDSFQNFAQSTYNKFDLIVTNPPFFENSLRPPEAQRSNARHNELLPFNEIIEYSLLIMKDTCRLALILPTLPAEKFIQLAIKKGLYVSKITKVKPSPNKLHHRYLMEFGLNKSSVEINEIAINDEEDLNYSDEYKKLTESFYLNL